MTIIHKSNTYGIKTQIWVVLLQSYDALNYDAQLFL